MTERTKLMLGWLAVVAGAAMVITGVVGLIMEFA
jgi:hypothetical protein